jgi:hypothetical protein
LQFGTKTNFCTLSTDLRKKKIKLSKLADYKEKRFISDIVEPKYYIIKKAQNSEIGQRAV